MPTTLFERSRKCEHALLIQPHAGGLPDEGALEEFGDLARSAGASVATVDNARIDRPNPPTLIGSGKLDAVQAAAEARAADLVLDTLPFPPAQERQLQHVRHGRRLARTAPNTQTFLRRKRERD